MPYTDYDAFDLLEELELSGAEPNAELLEAIVERGDETADGLLEMLDEGSDASWADEDPRHFRDLHAGLLLIEMAEPRALPIIERIYTDERDRANPLAPWFNPRLRRYGADALPVLERLLEDDEARMDALVALGEMAHDPELREAVVPVLRSQLPPANAPADVDPGDDNIERWTWAVVGLMYARDTDTRDRVETLYDNGWVQDWALDRGDYLEEVEAEDEDDALLPLPEYYTQQREEEEAALAQLEEMGQMAEMMEQLQSVMGLSEEETMGLMEQMEAFVGDDGDVDEDAAQEFLSQFMAERAQQYAPEPDELKIGRNQRVTIENPDTGETMTLKYKHAQKRLDEGWELIDPAA